MQSSWLYYMDKFCQHRGPGCLCRPEGGLLRPQGTKGLGSGQSSRPANWLCEPRKPVARPAYCPADLLREDSFLIQMLPEG